MARPQVRYFICHLLELGIIELFHIVDHICELSSMDMPEFSLIDGWDHRLFKSRGDNNVRHSIILMLQPKCLELSHFYFDVLGISITKLPS